MTVYDKLADFVFDTAFRHFKEKLLKLHEDEYSKLIDGVYLDAEDEKVFEAIRTYLIGDTYVPVSDSKRVIAKLFTDELSEPEATAIQRQLASEDNNMRLFLISLLKNWCAIDNRLCLAYDFISGRIVEAVAYAKEACKENNKQERTPT